MDLRKKHIAPSVCILCGDPFSGHHGSYQQAFIQAKELSKKGVQVIVISPNFDKTKRIFNVWKEREEKFAFCRISSRFFNNKIIRMISVTIYLFWIQKKFNIFQIITSHYCYIGYLLSLILKKRYIIATTSFRGHLVKPGKLQRIKLLAVSRADAIISKTDQLYNFYKKHLSHQSQIVKIPNGVDLERFKMATPEMKHSAREKLGFMEKDKLILFVGNILREKGVDILIDVFVRHRTNIGNLKLLLVGNKSVDDKFTGEIARKIKNNNLDDNVFLMGTKNKIELYYAASNTFVLPSRREGLPNVVLEAMACGLPCVVSRLGYTNDLIVNGNGYVFDLDRPDELWAKIKELSYNEVKRQNMGANARQIIEEQYSLQAVADSYCTLYHGLMLETQGTKKEF